MNEADTRAELIDPALKDAGWGVTEGSRIRREVITLGRLLGGGKRGKQEIADYLLVYKDQKLAVLEAKSDEKPDTEGVGQAKQYANTLKTPFAFSTNGKSIYQVDMRSGKEQYIDRYPTPDELWQMSFERENSWRDRFGKVPFEDKGGFWQPRYYQHNAINAALEAIAAGEDRILLTLATGTGKTAIAFQLAWKLFHSRWNLSHEPTRRPRILFLADRNILANQAFNAFSAFPEDALKRISPDAIRKEKRVPKNGSIFFTIFQTFMTGQDENGEPAPYFGEYPEDFFDFIVIDECHRGGAKDESNWRGILEYFKPAVQLGLTATPKRKINADTYAYFKEPVYVYSLKEGINDGYLTPFRVKQIDTTIDEYVFTDGDRVEEGQVEYNRRYTESDFNRNIEIREREAYRVKLFMDQIDQQQKTLVFCATQEHALIVRDFINQRKTSNHPDYCVRVTANDGALGEQHLSTFQDNDKTIPTILTTSQKLSTGVDARNIRNVVLLRPVNSMIEFKQIIGRGTRLFEGKDYFTIYDFVEAYRNFEDPEWDGEPVEPEPPGNPNPSPIPGPETPSGGDEGTGDDSWNERPKRLKIKLADGRERTFDNMQATTFWSPDGRPISADAFIKKIFGDIPSLFKDEAQLRKIWSEPATRRSLLEGLEEKGYGEAQMKSIRDLINAPKSDLYDVLSNIAFLLPTITREERVARQKTYIFQHYNDKEREFLDFVLSHYIEQGISELDSDKLPQLLELKYHSIPDAIAQLGDALKIREAFVGFQKYLYEDQKVG